VWPETNCSTDLWIELVHALRLDPVPLLAFTLSVDFEGDQWQLFTLPLEDLRLMYGIDVAEVNPWRGLEHHITEQLTTGRTLTAEVDSYYLPDTAGRSYQCEHGKTSIVPNMLDRDRKRMGYFHGAGYYELEGSDYRGALGLDRVTAPRGQLVKVDALERPDDEELLERTLDLVHEHIRRRPSSNPVTRFAKRFEEDLEWLRARDLGTFHAYAFATVRQFGACTQLSAALCQWLADRHELSVLAADHFSALSILAKTLQFKMARSYGSAPPSSRFTTGRAVDVAPLIADMERRWDAAMTLVADRHG
jgi:hypothetical protein